MGLLQRVLGIAPRAIRAFEAGRAQRRLRALPSSTQHINALIRSYGRTVLARSRYLAANNPYAQLAKEEFVSALIGAGIKPSPLIDDAAIKKAVSQAWSDWTDEADAAGLTDFYGLQAIVAAEMFEAGECFVRLRPRRPEDGLTVPLQLQLLPAEMLPLDRNEDLGGGRRIECGIEFGPIGNRVAYHFLTRHPGDDQPPSDPSFYTVVPADQVLHLFKPLRAGQVRGIPHTLAGIVTAAVHDAYEDAELERKRLAACFTAFVIGQEDPNVDHPLTGGAPNPPAARTGGEPHGDFGLEPGAVIDLGPGKDMKFAEPADVGGNFESFEVRILLRMAAGYGVPYHLMTGDLRQVNYSSIRAGLVAFRRRVEQLQHAVMVFQLCRPIWARFLDEAVLARAVPIPAGAYADRRRDFRRVKWIPPKWEWVDPQKDQQAVIDAINNGLTSRDDAIEERGEDPEVVDARIAAAQQRAEQLGLSFPGSAPRAAAAADPAADPAANDAPPAPALARVVEDIARDAHGRITGFTRRPVLVAERVEVTGHDGLGRITGTVTKPVVAEERV